MAKNQMRNIVIPLGDKLDHSQVYAWSFQPQMQSNYVLEHINQHHLLILQFSFGRKNIFC